MVWRWSVWLYIYTTLDILIGTLRITLWAMDDSIYPVNPRYTEIRHITSRRLCLNYPPIQITSIVSTTELVRLFFPFLPLSRYMKLFQTDTYGATVQPSPTSQKTTLRAQRRLYPANSNKALAEWFQQTYNHTLSSSTVSEVLSSHYRHLDEPLSNHHAHSTRIWHEHWLKLESALFAWIQRVKEQVVISGDIIREKDEFS